MLNILNKLVESKDLINFVSDKIKSSETPNGVNEMYNIPIEPQNKSPDITHTIYATLEDILERKFKKIHVKVKRICRECNGRGMTFVYPQVCENCNGQSSCSFCESQTEIHPCKIVCQDCKGRKWCIEKHLLNVPCFSNKIIYEEEADDVFNGIRGDIIIYVKPQEHKCFKLLGDHDLVMNLEIGLANILDGQDVTFQHIDGTKLVIPIEKWNTIQSQDLRKIIPNQGLWKTKTTRGDLHVNLIVRLFRKKLNCLKNAPK